jgi:hypothetical protein
MGAIDSRESRHLADRSSRESPDCPGLRPGRTPYFCPGFARCSRYPGANIAGRSLPDAGATAASDPQA